MTRHFLCVSAHKAYMHNLVNAMVECASIQSSSRFQKINLVCANALSWEEGGVIVRPYYALCALAH
jgi:hypothetical protein